MFNINSTDISNEFASKYNALLQRQSRDGKSCGVSAVTCYCFNHGTDSLYAFIAMLLLHGTLPNDCWCLF